MDASGRTSLKHSSPTFSELFTPKLVTILREGYGWTHLRADAVAGLTVAIVALPLSMAIAIGSGLSPDKGLYTAIIGGFLISALGGSRFQIGGPAGAFIVLIATIVERHGYDGLVLATLMAGAMMLAIGFLRFGTYIKYIPFPVTVGFTAGIAVIIFASQVKELLGLDIAKEPAALLPKIASIAASIHTIKPATVILSVLAIGIILLLRRHRPKWPGLLIAVGVTAMATFLLNLDVATIGSKFGGIPRALPSPSLPAFDIAMMLAVLPDAIAIALLGAIESLLSAVVADGMTGRRHRSNCDSLRRGPPISRPLHLEACVSLALLRAPQPMCAPVPMVRWRASFTLSTSCCSCSLRLRSRPTSHSRAWARCLPSSLGTWPKRKSSGACCGPRGGTQLCCWPRSC